MEDGSLGLSILMQARHHLMHHIPLLPQTRHLLLVFLPQQIQVHPLQLLLLHFADPLEEATLALQFFNDGFVGLDDLGVFAGDGFELVSVEVLVGEAMGGGEGRSAA